MAKGKKGSKKKIFIFGFLGLLLVVVVLMVVLGGNKEVIVSVQTEDVGKRNITQVVSATGTIFPIEQVILRPEVSGEIVELPVEEGDVVSKGTLLIRIKPDVYVAQRNRAKASLNSVKASLKVREAALEEVLAEYERIKGLYEKGLASESQLERAKSAYLQSEGSLEMQKASVVQATESLSEAEENLARTAIYSPMNGIVTQLNVEMSERVLGSGFSQGTHLMTVADLTQIEARVEVDENDIVLISLDDTTDVEIDAFRDVKFKGLVSQIGNSAETSGLGTQDQVVNFEVRIKLINNNSNIRPGMSCDADIQTETVKDVYSVPIQSVTARMTQPNFGGGEGNGDGEMKAKDSGPKKPDEVVFVVDGSYAKKVTVETGISDDSFIEIKSGLDGTEKVVTGPYRAISKELSDSVKVMVQGGGGKGPRGADDENSEN
ncbi:MAG: efflux RND transporter periplasmic adaptor subunit [Melioribacteraceae bacterium]|nr:efflux RND transporter periplasmic adaptor subunit [Melioribacteraceae bacterium]MCF8266121.1 efflux RND transporter periplasmic adaptor subunit [Melioribacteraceae bacterium]MCF8413612.1 efflux RND transporter periplasmic adaptor subunit [Melioribacteraceae bacterium]MCF8432784.1 efflux RND transporter periplasmic adaptor subunit [Melioribacteraceae bacterium]